MKRAIPALLLATVCGCSHYYDVDFSRAMKADGFEWDGTVRVCVERTNWFLWETGMQRVELRSKDGRAAVITSAGTDVLAHLEIKVTETRPAEEGLATQPTQPLEVRDVGAEAEPPPASRPS